MKFKTNTTRVEVHTDFRHELRDAAKRAKKQQLQRGRKSSADPGITSSVEKAVAQYGEVFRRLADE